jgi:peptidyl-prolyl cis-trans isomerase A (cyclophilin A)
MRPRLAWLAAATLWAAGSIACDRPGAPATAEAPAVSAPGEAQPQKPAAENKENNVVLIKTSKGEIRVELLADKAPITVKNFLSYVDDGFYDGTIFHRVIDGFMIQGGGFSADMRQKTTKAPIKNEADNGVKNARGTLAMARTSVVDSATAQFFINLVDNAMLNHGSRDFGYAVFGRVVGGMDVVDQIAKVPTGQKGPYGDVPVDTVTIQSIKRAP